MKYFLTFLFSTCIFFSITAQDSKAAKEKISVFIYKPTGKMYSSEEMENFSSKGPREWKPDGVRYAFKSNKDTIFYYIDPDYDFEKVRKKFVNDRLNTKAELGVLIDINGREFDEKDYQNNVVVLNFWGTWCGPCVKEIPELNELVETFHGKEVIFIAPTGRDDVEKVNNFLAKRPFNYQIIANALDISLKYAMAVPTNIIIDRNGIIRFMKIGYQKGMHDLLAKEIIKYM